MQLAETIFPDSAIFSEKTRVENRLWGKSEFWWGRDVSLNDTQHSCAR